MTLPSYQGDNINSDVFDEKARDPDPDRLLRAYSQSAGTLNLLRAFATGGYASIQRVTQWNLDFVEHSEQGDRCLALFVILLFLFLGLFNLLVVEVRDRFKTMASFIDVI